MEGATDLKLIRLATADLDAIQGTTVLQKNDRCHGAAVRLNPAQDMHPASLDKQFSNRLAVRQQAEGRPLSFR